MQTADPQAILRAAQADTPSVLDLAQALIRIPSRSGQDPYEPIIDRLIAWFMERALPTQRLLSPGGQVVGLAVDIHGGRPGSWYVLDACVDTPPYGDEHSWTIPPAAGVVVDGWLHGRGAADCKTAASIFAHLGYHLSQQAGRLRGGLTLLFDADEHTGRFGGIKQFLASSDRRDQIAGFMIGYPGPDEVVIGGRGFLRAEVTVNGIAAHSGSSRPTAGNAVEKAALLVGLLTSHPLPSENGSGFPIDPKLTVTAIRGGEPDGGYSLVPDRCTVFVDIRLTPRFNANAATQVLEQVRRKLDQQSPGAEATELRLEESWPPYRLPENAELSQALAHAAQLITGKRPALKVAGPSNIGNYLATLGIPATAGYGLRYEGLHGTNERVLVESIPVTEAVYYLATARLLGLEFPQESP